MASESSAFCPGHVTAFFEPVEDPDPFKKGSRGAGLSLSLGVKTRVKARLGRKQKVRIYLNREEVPAPTTRWAVERAIGGAAFEVIVQSEVQLPVSQGFGMSAAGALSAVLAVNDALDLALTHSRCVAIAHAAEVSAKTGLGDVVPASLGAMDIRLPPGAPPHAVVRRLPAAGDLLLAVLGAPVPKPRILSDAAKLRYLADVGGRCLKEFARNPSMADLFRLGREFALSTSLAKGKVKETLEATAPYGQCTMAMLGNSVFAVGQIEPLDAILKGMGAQRYRCKVDERGARLIT
ncbi:MAG TPA: GHMP kinase [Thermoplasmata archaeon]|nr:GHMP kinase [Thermoplasmata archaeon]